MRYQKNYDHFLKEEKLRKRKIAQFIKIGEIAEKAGIDQLEPEVLMSAFHLLAQAKDNFQEWYKSGYDMLRENNIITYIPVTHKPSPDILTTLGTFKFYFDPFQNRFFGPAHNKEKAEITLNRMS